MAIILPSGFQITNNEPVDSRYSVANSASRLGFSAANVYEGMTVYEQDTNKYFILIDSGSYNIESGWQEVGKSINTGSFALTSSNSFNGNQFITGSVFVTGSLSVTGSFYVTGALVIPTVQTLSPTAEVGSIVINNNNLYIYF